MVTPSPPDVQNVPDVWNVLEQAQTQLLQHEHAHTVPCPLCQIVYRINVVLAQRNRFVLVPKEPGHDRLELIFDWVMGKEADDKGHYWGTSDQVAKAKELWALLLAAAPKPDGKP